MIILPKLYVRKYRREYVPKIQRIFSDVKKLEPKHWSDDISAEIREAKDDTDAWLLGFAQELFDETTEQLNEELGFYDLVYPPDLTLFDTLKQRMLDYNNLFWTRAETDLRRAVISSESIDELKAEIDRLLSKYRNLYIRTASYQEPMELMHGYVYEVLRRLQEMGYTVKLQWFTVHDDRVCTVCRALDGRAVPIGKPFTFYRGKPVYRPPLHGNCRCGIKVIIG